MVSNPILHLRGRSGFFLRKEKRFCSERAQVGRRWDQPHPQALAFAEAASYV